MGQFTNRTLLTILSLFCFLTVPTLAQDVDPELAVVAVDWHPNGYMFAEVLSDGQVKLIDWLNGEVYASVTTDGAAFLTFAEVEWNQSGDMLAAGIGMYVYIWDYPSINLRYQFLVGDPAGEFYVESGDWIPEQIETLSWSPDNRIAVVALSGRVTVWDVEGSLLLTEFTVGNGAQPIVWTEDYAAVTNSFDVYDVVTGNKTPLALLGFLAGAGTYAARQDNTNIIATSDVFGNVGVYDLTTTTLLGQYDLSETNAAIWDISWEPDSNRFATVDDEGIVSIVDIEQGIVEVVQDFGGRLFTVDWHPKEDMLLVGGISDDGTPILEKISTVATLAQDENTDLAVMAVDWHPNGEMFAQVMSNGQVQVIDRLTGEVIITPRLGIDSLFTLQEVSWNESGDILAAGINQYLYVWNYPSGDLRSQLLTGDPTEQSEANVSLVWSPDNRIAVSEYSGKITIWDINENELLAEFSVGNSVLPIIWTNDYSTVTNSVDYYNVTTNVRSGALMSGGYSYGVDMAKQDGTNIVARSDTSGSVGIFDLSTHSIISEYVINNKQVHIAQISWEPNGSRFATVDDEGIVSIVDIDVDMEHDPVRIVQDYDGRLFAVDWHPTEEVLLVGGISDDGNPVLEMIPISQYLND